MLCTINGPHPLRDAIPTLHMLTPFPDWMRLYQQIRQILYRTIYSTAVRVEDQDEWYYSYRAIQVTRRKKPLDLVIENYWV
jgi:hypothetical protein